MGWASGSDIGTGFWEEIRENIIPEKLEETARALINALEDQDCDTIYECEQLVIDAGLEEEYWPDDEEYDE
jgi:hypothetical protein